MTPQQIVGLGLRVFALILISFCIKYLVLLPASMRENLMGSQAYLSYAIGLVGVILALVCWFFPLVIANFLIPRTRFENHINIQPLEVARVGTGLIGLWVLATGMPNFIWLIFLGVISATSGESAFSTYLPEEKADFVFHFCQFLIAYVLIFKSGLIAEFLIKKSTKKSIE